MSSRSLSNISISTIKHEQPIFIHIRYKNRLLMFYLVLSNSLVSRAIWKNRHSWVFQRFQMALVLWTRVILIVFQKLTRAYFFPNCTRNHTMTYTNTSELITVTSISLSSLYVRMAIKHKFTWCFHKQNYYKYLFLENMLNLI